MRRGLVLVVLLLCSCSSGSLRPTATPPPSIEVEEYAVYGALIQQNPLGSDLGSLLVIREQTVGDLKAFERALEEVGRLPAGLADSYRARNAASYTVGANLDVAEEYTLMPQGEHDEILGKGGAGWPRFGEKYPEARGLVFFSRVGFDAKGRTALVSMGFRCGDLCGSGGLYLLVKEDGDWKLQRGLMEWMS